MSGWKIEYDNDTGPNDEGFWEWWTVSNHEYSFKCSSEEEAEFLKRQLSMVWQPISTAPKDGAPILVWDGKNMTTVSWHSGYDHDEWSLCAPGLYADDYAFYPTHWMPLPEPPKET